jgi:hypothetical protein
MDNYEKQRALSVIASSGMTFTKLGLRFDKVVVQLLGDLRAFVEHSVPSSLTVIVTLTAPIKLPNKTEQAIEEGIDALLAASKELTASKDWNGIIFENSVHIRVVKASDTKQKHRLVGFVHNPTTEAIVLLQIAEGWVREQ